MQWALSTVVWGNGLAESTVAGWLTHSDAILVIGKVSPKKAAVLLDIVQMRGGGAIQGIDLRKSTISATVISSLILLNCKRLS